MTLQWGARPGFRRPRRARVKSGGHSEFEIWTRADKVHWSLASMLAGTRHDVVDAQFNPAHPLLVTASKEGVIQLWDTTTWRTLGSMRRWGRAGVVNFSTDGRLLAVAESDQTTVWQTADWQAAAKVPGLHCFDPAVALSTDGRMLALSGSLGTVQVWDTTTSTLLRELGGQQFGVTSLSFSPNGRLLAANGPHSGLRMWELPPQSNMSRSNRSGR
jgi:WD40 repeat protein